MPPNTAPEEWTKTVNEARTLTFVFEGKLFSSELLSGTPTVTVVPASVLTVASVARGTVDLAEEEFDSRDSDILASTYVQCLVSAGAILAGEDTRDFLLTCQCGTDDSQTLELIGKLTLTKD